MGGNICSFCLRVVGIFSVCAAALLPMSAVAQNHYVYNLDPTSTFFDIQGTPVVQDADNPISWGNGSFLSQVTGAQTLMYINLHSVFQTTGLTIGDIAGFNYYTRKTDDAVTTNWSARIYTEKADSASWFKYRFDAGQHNAPDTDWAQWDSSDSNHFYQIVDRTSGSDSVVYDTPYSWSHVLGNSSYTDLELLYFAFLLVPSSQAETFNHIARIEFQLANGDTAVLNLIPEPAHIAGIILLALFGFVFWRRYVRSRKG